MMCPCCSGKPYSECCKPFHEGLSPKTALELMRSRYSAYALGVVDYIVETTHPKNPHFEMDKKAWRKKIQAFCQTSRFEKLEILGYGENWVHFKAHLGSMILDEKSQFEKVDGKWLYLSGEIH